MPDAFSDSPSSMPAPRSPAPGDPALAGEAARQAALDAYRLFDTGPEPALDDIVRLVTRVCDVPGAVLSLIDRDLQRFKARIGIDCDSTPRRVSICDHTIRTPETPLVIPDVARDPRFADLTLRIGGEPVRFYAGVPVLGREGHALGALCAMDVRPRELADEQLDSLRILARQTRHLLELRCFARDQRRLAEERASTLRKAEASRQYLQEEMAQILQSARMDPLTGLLNRAALQQLRSDPDALRRLDAGPYCLVVLDIDHFKRINDTHGHREGDRALRAVGEAVEASIRHDDVAVRFGGEEFLLVLPETGVEAAVEVAERIRAAVAGLELPFSPALTVSAGVAAGDPALGQPEAVFERADRALYRAKEGGRDRVVVADAD
ncbi:sensor domain-containing diguanylate cyclase [Lysobacter sp. GX 14042]|uniref:GGDEF domain-containing protein n=1 Tax=Lysobacter sp. GX 14042 TaxID=2907155 RepID=UPI001F36548A|nr:sensor domain-containing diguanylate cyclase [Lysobacter sp. GX 14042]MCE7032003.1 sensor domain-containing diguanylate cyclase [Lysobacter sp. GX 14042]